MTENLNFPAKKKKGRPKGVKNKKNKKKSKLKIRKKRGRKGFRTVFNKDKRGYAKVDPYRKTVQIGKEISPAVSAALGEVVNLYVKNYIQNNLAEHKNSLLSKYLVLSGPKTAESVERRIRTLIIYQNNPNLIDFVNIRHNFQCSFLRNQIINSPLLGLLV
ncbi:hypothetical protein [Candidatus Harpocratesius sp.]